MDRLQLLDLPSDIHQLLMTYLQLTDFREFACTCKHFHQASKAAHVYTKVLGNELRARELGSSHHLPKGTLERVLHRAWTWERVVNTPILDLVIDPNRQVWCNEAFVYACGRGCMDFVRLLLSNRFGVRPDILDNGGIERACKNGHTQIAKLLLNWHTNNKVDVGDVPNDTHVHESNLKHRGDRQDYVDGTDVDNVKYQTNDVDVDPSVNWNRSFRLACRNNQVSIVKLLLEDKRVDPCAKGSEGIRVACKRGFTDLLEVLLQDGRSDPGVSNNLPLRLAVKCLSYKAVAMLVDDRRVDPSVNEHEPLKYATRHARNDIVLLLRKGERQRESAVTWSGNRNPMLTPLEST